MARQNLALPSKCFRDEKEEEKEKKKKKILPFHVFTGAIDRLKNLFALSRAAFKFISVRVDDDVLSARHELKLFSCAVH